MQSEGIRWAVAVDETRITRFTFVQSRFVADMTGEIADRLVEHAGQTEVVRVEERSWTVETDGTEKSGLDQVPLDEKGH